MRLAIVFGFALLGCPKSDGAADEGDPAARDGGPSGPPRWIGVEGARLGPLPPHKSATSPRFATNDACAQCHLAGDGPAVRDAKGRDVSPVGTWRTTAMALSARDPHYLAVFADERAARPNLTAEVDATCTRCHAPEGSVEAALEGKSPTFPMLTGDDASATASLAREGVACTLCHQIDPDNLGKTASFTGGFVVGDLRRIYGPYTDPFPDPMRMLVNYLPTFGGHVQKSALCATCHTVITRPRDAKGNVGPEFPEQVTYFEWLASAFANEDAPGPKAASCQDCHMNASDDDGNELATPIARVAGIKTRKPYWRHGFSGANVQLTRFGAADPSWFGTTLTKDDHLAQGRLDEAMIKRGAKVTVAETKRTGDGVEIVVRVENLSGHKFPTGYPSRRAFLHVTVKEGDKTVFESGKTDSFGRLVDLRDKVIESATFAPHVDVVDRDDAVQIYESVPVDYAGRVSRRPLDDHHYAKDNRLLPAGFDRKSRYSAYVSPRGTDGDADWGDTDLVRFRVRAATGASIAVRLELQTMRPSDIEALAEQPTPAARRLFDFATAAPPVPVVVSEAAATAP